MTNRRWKPLYLTATIFVLLCVLCAAAVQALEKPKDYPKRPITMIVPFGAGGGSDQVARAIAPPLEKVLGVPIQIVNKPGGNATVGFADFWATRPDGYTLLQYVDDAATHYAAGILDKDPTEDYIPLCIAQIAYSQLYIRSDEKKFSDWDSLVAYAKAHPGAVTVANIAQEGNLERILMDQLQTAAGVKFTQVSFDKPGERYAALVGGHVDALLEQPGDVKAYLESGDMKPVITLLKSRPKAFPDAPCVADLDLDMKILYKVRGFYVKKGTPDHIIRYLEASFKDAWDSEQFQKFNNSKYLMDLSYMGTEEAKSLLKEMIATYIEVYKNIGLIKK